MIVYHGSNMVVENPDISHSTRALDFGNGFYVTTVREQAEKWAKRKANVSKNHSKAILNIYEMDDDPKMLKYKDFSEDRND